MSKLYINKALYMIFLTKMYKERNYHEDFTKLNQEKLEILNRYSKLDGKIKFEDKKIILKPLDELDLSKLKNIKGFEKFNNFEKDKDNLVSYINTYFNMLMERINFENYKISLGIEYCTNDTNEFVKNLMNQHTKNTVISSHMEQIHKQYKEAILILFNSLYPDITLEINWGVEITNEKDKEKLLFELDEFDYF